MLELSLMPPARVRTAGEIRNHPYHSTPGTKQGDVMLIAVLGGKGYYEDDGGILPVEGGMIGIIPDARPGILYADHLDPYHKAYCRFGGDYARAMAVRVLGSRRERFFHDPRTADLGERIRRMGHIHRRELPELLTGDGVMLLDTLRTLGGGGALREGLRLTGADIRNYLSERVSSPTDLGRAARDLGVSRSTLCRTAQKDTGLTVQRLHQGYKIEWAKRLLQSRRMSIAEVAYRVGFSDPYYFSRVFRRVTGRSPRRWRDGDLP
jgi:AraC-like DNA-binding protein